MISISTNPSPSLSSAPMSSFELQSIKSDANTLVNKASSALATISPVSHNSSRFVSMRAVGMRTQSHLNEMSQTSEIDSTALRQQAQLIKNYLQEF